MLHAQPSTALQNEIFLATEGKDNKYTSWGPSNYASRLRKCAEERSLKEGQYIHWHILSSGCIPDRYLKNHLMFMYAKCGCTKQTLDLFHTIPNPNVFTWTALLTAYAQTGQQTEVLDVFRRMQLDGSRPDTFVLSTVITSCATHEAISDGKSIHQCIVSEHMECGVVGNSLINLYGKCHCIEEARVVFDRMRGRNTISWNSIIAAYAQSRCMGPARSGHLKEAVRLFHLMDLEGIKTDNVTFVSIVDACAELMDSLLGQVIHERVASEGFMEYLNVGNALVNMYGKCGKLHDAERVFRGMRKKDVFTWTSMVAGYARGAHSEEALNWYREMDLEGIAPNDVTFVSLLFACSHSGLLHTGREFFLSMVGDHYIQPSGAHYGCMIDLLGRAGRVGDAKELLEISPYEQRYIEWITLLNACKLHENVAVAEVAAKEVFVEKPKYGVLSAYLLLQKSEPA